MSTSRNHTDIPHDSPGKCREPAVPILSAPAPCPGDPVPEIIDDIKRQIADLEAQIEQHKSEAEHADAERKLFAIKSVHLCQDVLDAGAEIPDGHLKEVTKLMDDIDWVDAEKAKRENSKVASFEGKSKKS